MVHDGAVGGLRAGNGEADEQHEEQGEDAATKSHLRISEQGFAVKGKPPRPGRSRPGRGPRADRDTSQNGKAAL